MLVQLTPCTEHWDKIRNAVIDRGLGIMIPDDGEQAQELMERRSIEGPNVDNFDPLMGALMDITGRIMDTGAPVRGCPVCFLNVNCMCPKTMCGEDWIDYAADDQLELWQSFQY